MCLPERDLNRHVPHAELVKVMALAGGEGERAPKTMDLGQIPPGVVTSTLEAFRALDWTQCALPDSFDFECRVCVRKTVCSHTTNAHAHIIQCAV